MHDIRYFKRTVGDQEIKMSLVPSRGAPPDGHTKVDWYTVYIWCRLHGVYTRLEFDIDWSTNRVMAEEWLQAEFGIALYPLDNWMPA